MLRRKLPTVVSPPKLSLFWSVPWPYENSYVLNKLDNEAFLEYYHKKTKHSVSETRRYNSLVNQEEVYSEITEEIERCANARMIKYKGENIRVWPEEFSPVSIENMNEYILGEDQAYEFVADNVAEQNAIQAILDGESKLIYDAALVDGCNHNQAMITALGKDITIEDAEFPAIGWYRIKKEFGMAFCRSERELEETDSREKSPAN
jgi:hypothetical protein